MKKTILLAGILLGVVREVGLAQGAFDLGTQISPMSTESFVHYEVPAECAWAAQWWENLYWRDRRSDTMPPSANGRPFEPQSQHTVEGCVANFAVSNAPERDLLGLAQAALAAGQTGLADSALSRLTKLMLHASPTLRALMYLQANEIYLSAPQPNLPEAEAYAAKLDGMGPSTAAEAMLAHTALANEAQRRDSLLLWEREAQRAVAASKAITGDAEKDYAFEVAAAYIAVARLKERQNDVAGAKAILAEGRAALIPLRPAVAASFTKAEAWVAMQGQSPGPVQATRWGTAGDSAIAHPTAGKAALVAFVSANCGSLCYDDYGVLRRLMLTYAGASLDFILVTHTEGYAGDRLVAPDTEMGITEDYFLNYLHFSATLGMWKGVYTKREDGALILQLPPTERAYQPPRPPSGHITVAVLDARGVIRLYTTLERNNEILLKDVLKSLLERP